MLYVEDRDAKNPRNGYWVSRKPEPLVFSVMFCTGENREALVHRYTAVYQVLKPSALPQELDYASTFRAKLISAPKVILYDFVKTCLTNNPIIEST